MLHTLYSAVPSNHRFKPGIVVHIFTPNTQEAERQAEFKVSLVYIVEFHSWGYIVRLCLQNTKQKRRTEIGPFLPHIPEKKEPEWQLFGNLIKKNNSPTFPSVVGG